MANDLKVPALGESISHATIARWLKKEGEAVKRDEPLVELETDKVTLEVNAPSSGILTKVSALENSLVTVGQILGSIEERETDVSNSSSQSSSFSPDRDASSNISRSSSDRADLSNNPAIFFSEKNQDISKNTEDSSLFSKSFPSPAARKLAEEKAIDLNTIPGSGIGGRVTKKDILKAITPDMAQSENFSSGTAAGSSSSPPHFTEGLLTERVHMTRLRQRIAERLKEAQNTAAMLTTFNEIDMSQLMLLRDQYREKFEKRYETKLGFMSFFVKAAVAALKEIPTINAEIEGEEIVYKYYYDIGVAVSAPQGLIVPIVRHADQLSFAEIEMKISQLAEKARQNKLSLEDLTGGTFTITNGGVFGSLMSTPILNPPQSGILGMHKIQKRPVVVEDKIEIRPMMYIALTYDHRLIDGREAVTFLVKIKESLEDPRRMLLAV